MLPKCVMKRKGLTLVEIIISLALIGIISVAFVAFFGTNIKLLNTAKSITKTAFAAQKDIERLIEEKKQQIISDTAGSTVNYTLFEGTPDEVTVEGYPVFVNITSPPKAVRKIYTIVAKERMDELEVPVVTSFSIKYRVNNIDKPYVYTTAPNLDIKSDVSHDASHQGTYLMDIYKWYVSREGFNIPLTNMPSGEYPLEIEVGSKYPRFPDDYTIIGSARDADLKSILSGYAGRFIVCTVTPVAKSGKMGTTISSNPVLIPGLTVTGNLFLHLDASMILRSDSGAVRKVAGTGGAPDRFFVKQWNDISWNSGYTGYNSNNASQSTVSLQPELVEEKFGSFADTNNITQDTYAKFVRFSGGQSLVIPNSSSLNLNELTVFVVAKSTDQTSVSKSIISKYLSSSSDKSMWRMGWNAANLIGFRTSDGNSTPNVDVVDASAAVPTGPLGAGLDGMWHVLRGESGIRSGEAMRFSIDNNLIASKTRSCVTITNNQSLTIGWDARNGFSTVDVAEILIFSGTLSPSDRNAVENYLDKKYRPVAPGVFIYMLRPINNIIIRDQPFIMPENVIANMTDGTTRNAPVVWSPSSIDTTTLGRKTSTGTSITDNSKAMTLTVDVVSITAFNNMEATVNQNDTFNYPEGYSLPTEISADLSNGMRQLVPVTWDDPSNINISNYGVVSRPGIVTLDGGHNVTFTLNIKPYPPVTGVTLNNEAISITEGGSYSALAATVEPSNASDKTLIWTSSNDSIAAVDGNGVVTALAAGGPVTITVRTEDGGFTDTCEVTVLPAPTPTPTPEVTPEATPEATPTP